MKACVAQIRPVAGDVSKNIEAHRKLIDLAVSVSAEIVIFPELSLTGYEPKLAQTLATTSNDSRFDEFQKISDAREIVIGVGMPLKGDAGILIGMIIFQPGKERQAYSKRYLHADELPYFISGDRDVLVELRGEKIAPAICYESLLPEHSQNAFELGASVYIASVAKSAKVGLATTL